MTPSPSCQKEGAEKASCLGRMPVTLKLAQRIVLLRRLEANQLNMISLRQEHALNDVFVNRAIRLADDDGLILDKVLKRRPNCVGPITRRAQMVIRRVHANRSSPLLQAREPDCFRGSSSSS